MKSLKWIAAAAIAIFAAGASPAEAKLDIMAANQDLAWVTKSIGGANVDVDYLAGSNQDPHQIDPRPSQVARISRADGVVRIGLDLDIWFDALIRAAGNGSLNWGQRGSIDASRGVRLLEVPAGKLDPSQGDIHVLGNPHYFYGPTQFAAVANNIRNGLKRLDPGKASTYDANYNTLVGKLNDAMKGWKAKLADAKGKLVVPYHRSLSYFLFDFGIQQMANVEPKPGLEPTPGHVSNVAKQMKADGVKVILTESWRSRRFSDLLARQSGATVVALPGGIGADKSVPDYFALMNVWVDRVAAAL